MPRLADLATPTVTPKLDPAFRPLALADRAFLKTASEPCVIGIERPDGSATRFETRVGDDADLNNEHIERTVKFLLWQRGGHKIVVSGTSHVAEHVANCFSLNGPRAFDANLVASTVFESDLQVVHSPLSEVPEERTRSLPIGRHFEGCRIGFDLGASDRKVAAVIDGNEVFTEETVWDPQGHSDPEYHYCEIKRAIESAKRHLPRLDAIGGSSAGVIVDKRVMVASIFRRVSKHDYPKARDVFMRLQSEFGVPLEVANDGDVTALAGAISLDEGRLLGIAMGSSEAGGYVDTNGNITGWLNELAFTPIDCAPTAPRDEWSGDIGCGVQYLTQQAVFRLAPSVGIDLAGTDVLAEKLKIVQGALETGHEGARRIWETIGVYFGYAIAHYAAFYDLAHVLVLGRVTSGSGGPIIVESAQSVLDIDFPELARSIKVSLPDERARRVGQAVAAASLPAI